MVDGSDRHRDDMMTLGLETQSTFENYKGMCVTNSNKEKQ